MQTVLPSSPCRVAPAGTPVQWWGRALLPGMLGPAPWWEWLQDSDLPVLWVLLSTDWLGSKGVRALRVRPGALMHHGTWGLREPGRPHLGGTLPCCPGGCEFGVQWGGTPDLRAGMSGCVCPGQGRGGENCCLSGFSGC